MSCSPINQVCGIKRSEHPESSPDISKREKIASPLTSLPDELISEIFSFLIPNFQYVSFSMTCKKIHALTLKGILAYFNEKTTLTFEEIMKWRLPLFQLLICSLPAFQEKKSNLANVEENSLKKLWFQFSIPEIFFFIILNCKNLEILDLRNDSYSLSTFFGEFQPFYPNEVATQDKDDPMTPSQQMQCIEPMKSTFQNKYPVLTCLLKLKSLKVISLSEDDLNNCVEICPNIEIFEIYQGKFCCSTLKDKLENFPHFKSFRSDKYCTIDMSFLRSYPDRDLELRNGYIILAQNDY